MGFAEQTTISTPTGAVQLGELRVADLVLAAGRELNWQQYSLQFAETVVGPAAVIVVQLANGVEIVGTPDAVFLDANLVLRRAQHLQPGDHLLNCGRERIGVAAVVAGHYEGALCAISTTSPAPLDGHLLEANGVIVADYYVEGRDE